MATMTHAGPIGIDQINHTVYVGAGAFATIQAAVDFARIAGGGLFTVVIPFGYTGSDTIAAVTGGGNAILQDLRNGLWQTYGWDGSQYLPGTFYELGGFVAQGMPVGGELGIPAASMLLGFDPTGTSGAGDGNIIVASPSGHGRPGLNFILDAKDGVTPTINMMRMANDALGTPLVKVGVALEAKSLVATGVGDLTLPQTVRISSPVDGGYLDFFGTDPATESSFRLRVASSDGSLFTPVLYGDSTSFQCFVPSDFTGPLNINGDMHLTGTAGITANAAHLLTTLAVDGGSQLSGPAVCGQTLHVVGNVTIDGSCSVGGSPVVSMKWPSAGIGVSTGSAWGTSLDPATIQGKLTLTTTGTTGPSTLVGTTLNIPQYAGVGGGMVYPPSGIAVSTGPAWGASINPATLATYPPLGIPNSTGSAWGTSINPATLATYPAAGVAVSTGSAWGTPIAAATLARLNTANTFTTDQTINTSVSVGGIATAPSNVSISMAVPTVSRILTKGDTGTLAGGMNLSGVSGDGSTYTDYVTFRNSSAGVFATAVTGNFSVSGLLLNGAIAAYVSPTFTSYGQAATMRMTTSNGNIFFSGQGGIMLNFDQGGYVAFGNGAGTQVGSIDNTGHAIFASLAVSGAKTFRVSHPLDETKDLYHACLEGPENGVFYRGEAQVVDGYAVVTLPDYFEALTYPEDRSVQLTQIWEDLPLFARLAASRVVDGKFTIHATDDVTVWWEVKAVRRIGVDRLKVVQDKPEPQPAQ